MCTAISFLSKDHYFGRNLDLEYHYKETVTITPRNYPFTFRFAQPMNSHYAMIGMATVSDNFPLYYDATNEFGLSMAGLNFPGNAVYLPQKEDRQNIAPFEFIPWILGQCKNTAEAMRMLEEVNLVNVPFNEEFTLSPLHWMMTDREKSIVVEPTESGIIVFEDPMGVLTNNPPFDFHLQHLSNYINLTREEPENRFSDNIELSPYSRGMGAMGLPGDLSSSSRFIRAAFTKLNSICEQSESSSISQFFHILDAVAQTKGCVKVNGAYEITIYTSCCNTDKCIYYYKSYENNQITAVHLYHQDLDTGQLYTYPLVTDQQIRNEN